jgi:hypothetical protein
VSSKRLSEGLFPWFPLDEQAATPATPAAGTYRLYVDDNGELALLDDDGQVQRFGDEPPNPTTIDINTQTSSYQLTAPDAGKVVRINTSGATDVTVPDDVTEEFPIGAVVSIRQVGTGAVTVVEASGVTVHHEPGFTLTLRGRYSEVSLHKVAAGTWEAAGGLTVDE